MMVPATAPKVHPTPTPMRILVRRWRDGDSLSDSNSDVMAGAGTRDAAGDSNCRPHLPHLNLYLRLWPDDVS